MRLSASMSGQDDLGALAALFGVETRYWDGLGQERTPSDEAVLGVLRSLGAQIGARNDVRAAMEQRRNAIWGQALPPASVAWDGHDARLYYRVPAERAWGHFRATVRTEGGESRSVEEKLSDMAIVDGTQVGGVAYQVREIPLGDGLPLGYHTVSVEHHERSDEALLLASPRKAFLPEDERGAWGVFIPLYALHSQRSAGAGDLTDLDALSRWVGDLGGGVVGTLPLLATFLDRPFEPSPYAPVSRRFWNELFLDPERLPEFSGCEEARTLLVSEAYLREAEALRQEPLVDYRRQMALRRSVLERLSRCAFRNGPPVALDDFLRRKPDAVDYARFRATTETRQQPWHAWPEREREGTLLSEDCDQDRFHYHLYAQWRTDEQVRQLKESADASGTSLYLDLPLGVHADGYDAWKSRDAFLAGCSAGAPPDGLFAGGQDWGFRPLSPEGIRRDRYGYLASCLRHQMGAAGVLRIDHVMGLHRIFCVPEGHGATDGVYVRYHPEELYGLLTLESHRHQCMLVGEDLGTVPDEVRHAMREHALQRMYVFPFEIAPGEAHPVMHAVPPDAVASINTHDMPTFQGFWSGRDVDVRVELGLTGAEDARAEHGERQHFREGLAAMLGCAAEPEAVLKAALARLAESDARLLLVNLEDLWLEPEPQNVPGTWAERPNWRRKARLGLEEIRSALQVAESLQDIERRRLGRRV